MINTPVRDITATRQQSLVSSLKSLVREPQNSRAITILQSIIQHVT